MLYIKLFIEREKNTGQSAPECPFKYTLSYRIVSYVTLIVFRGNYGFILLSFRYMITGRTTDRRRSDGCREPTYRPILSLRRPSNVMQIKLCLKAIRSREYTAMERLFRLSLWTLEERRNRCDLIEVFKMFYD